MALYFFVLPVGFFQVSAGQQQHYDRVYVLRRPADRDVGPQVDHYVERIEDIDQQRRHFQRQRRAGVSRSRNRVEQDDRRHGQQVSRQHDPQRRHRAVDQRDAVGVNTQYGGRKQREQQSRGSDRQVAHADDPTDGRHYERLLSRSHLVAHERTGGRGEGADRHEDNPGYAAYDVADGQRPLAEVFDREKEQEPRGDRDEGLQHRPHRDVQHPSEQPGTGTGEPEQPVFAMVGFQPRVEDEKERRSQFRGRRCDSGSGDAHGRKSEFTEDQRVIQRHVGQHHRDRIGREYLRIGRADVERPEHNGDEREEKAVNAPVRIADRRVADRAGVDDPAQHDRRERPRDDEHDGGQQQQEQDSLLQQRADIRVCFFAVPPCDQNLRSDAEPEPDHENSHVIDSRERRSA